VGGRGGVAGGAVPVGGHRGLRAALPAGRRLVALGDQRRQLEGVQLHPGEHGRTQAGIHPVK